MVDNNENTTNPIDEHQEHVINYVKSLAAIEEAMEPFKEQKRGLKNNYIENGWLSREDISLAVKAFRMIQKNTDPEQLMDYYNTVNKKLR
tara:strand:- start:1227 stop:1496 length:270 start_codon:yes stop_codon:yes gene_type:complete